MPTLAGDLIITHPVIEEVLPPYREACGDMYEGLYGHAYRMLNLCVRMVPGEAEQIERFAIVAAFHDLPACLTRSLRYLEPAQAMAAEHLDRIGRAEWTAAVAAMIGNHHKVRTYLGPHRAEVEAVRRADWIDGTGGLRHFGTDRTLIRAINKQFPPGNLVLPALKLITAYAVRHPTAPLPMMRW